MKTLKKAFAMILAMALAVSMFVGVTALADEGTSDYSITITNTVAGQSYKAWKIFDVTTSTTGEGSGAVTNYAYTIPTNRTTVLDAIATNTNGVYDSKVDGVTLTLSADDTCYIVSMRSGEDTAKALAAALLAAESSLGTESGSATVEEGETSATIYVSDGPGYYFVDSSLGSLCILDTAAKTFEIAEKNGIPSEKKEIVVDGEGKSSTSASVGDTVDFKITVTAGGKADTTYVVHDTMTDGLSLNKNSFKVQVDDTDVENTNYTINYTDLTDGCTFEVTFLQTYTSTLVKGTEIVITYSATVNSNAVTLNKDTNKSHLDYGASSSTEQEVTVYNYDFDLVKTDTSNNILSGAKFELYSDEACTKEVKVSAETGETGNYIVDPDGTATITAGHPTIKGLAAGTYYLVETEAPNGYNPLDKAITVPITDGDLKATLSNDSTTYTSGGVEVENKAGSELPSTGGIGTTIFYIVGGVLVAGAGITLIVRKRMSGYQD